ncbi:hypothetical protein AVEN_94761-1 [Araneus ventricosus]|uniref:Uncharacterized protein n=1 Tax=Araneus ventricosus TaxID=182803 RepID=A0A4Y2CQ71_ARAVE|nr:hypothetical protein AVEN_94761-1 [Araneus ventricosus]
MRDDFEGVNFLAGKRTWKYKARKLEKKKVRRKKKRRDGRGLSFSNEERCWNDWNGLPVTQRHKKNKKKEGKEEKGETEEEFFSNEEPLLERLE